MSIYLDPTGKSSYGIGLCARCSKKVFLSDLQPDPNYPGLMVCLEDLDSLDPYRLSSRVSESINLEYVRPDSQLIDFSSIESALPVPGDLRLTDDGDYRVTDDGDYREVVL